MRMIFCNIQLFSNDQVIQVIDDSGTIHYQKVDIEDLVRAICANAGEFDVDSIKLTGGGNVYAHAWADEVRTALALNYSNKNIIVEVI